jgi:succinate dehydrogenase / fumarate reductase cytochrome b subunit
MTRFQKAFRSSIGRKLVMALTGLALLGFVFAHMAGNLQIFAGPEKLNAYAKTLQDLGPLLWVARIGLLAVFALHVKTGIELARENAAARPQKYAVTQYDTSTLASRTMILSGLVVLAFVLFHLLHFTFGAVDGSSHANNLPRVTLKNGEEVKDVYRMVVTGFRNPGISLVYVIANVVLGLHLMHGVSSVFQTLGCTSPRLACAKKAAGPLVAAVVVLGNCAIPLAVWAGIVGAEVK